MLLMWLLPMGMVFPIYEPLPYDMCKEECRKESGCTHTLRDWLKSGQAFAFSLVWVVQGWDFAFKYCV